MKRPPLTPRTFVRVVLCGISTPFGMLFPTQRQITHVLLTRAPLYQGRSPFSLDLHVLSAPLTFVLSQDQTLQYNWASYRLCRSRNGSDFVRLPHSRRGRTFGLVCGAPLLTALLASGGGPARPRDLTHVSLGSAWESPSRTES